MLRSYRGAFIAIGLVLLCGSHGLAQHPGLSERGQAEQNEQIEQEQSEAEAEQRPEPAPTAPQAQERAADHRERTSDSPDKRSNDYLLWGEPPAQWIMAFTSFASVVVALVAVCLVRRTLHEAQKTTEAAMRSVAQARRANEAAHAAVGVTRELGQKELAAYIFVTQAQYQIDNLGFYVSIFLKNAGKTPAVNTDTEVQLAFTYFDADTLKPYREDIRMVGGGAGSIEQDSERMAFSMALRGSFSERTWSLLLSEQGSATIWCKVIWQDIFGEWSDLLYMLDPARSDESVIPPSRALITKPLTVSQARLHGFRPDARNEAD